MISILFIFSVISLSEGFDWCPLIKPKGSYNGLGFYRRFDKMGQSTYHMFNRNGKQWTVKINGLNSEEVKLIPVETSVSDTNDKDVSNKFGTFATYDKLMGKEGGMERNCIIYKQKEPNYKMVCGPLNVIEPDFDDLVIVKVRPELTEKDRADTLMFRKHKKSIYWSFNPFGTSKSKPLIDCTQNKTNVQSLCAIPPFISDIDDEYFNKIDSIVEFVLRGLKGHIILFNIDGRPKYCTTIDGQSLSDQCKSSEKLRTLFDDCTDTQRPDTTNSNGLTESPSDTSVGHLGESKSSSNFVLIFVVITIIAVIILALILAIVLYIRKRKSSRNQSIQESDKVLKKSSKTDSTQKQKKTSMKTTQTTKK